jgi:small subunit ribosomal protein S1
MNDQPKSDFASMFEAENQVRPGASGQKARRLNLGESVRGEVVQIGRDSVFVEVLDRATMGKRPQAVINIQELRDAKGELTVKTGDVIEAVVVEVGDDGVRLGRSMGKPAGLQELETAFAAGIAVEGTVTGVNKGGLEVDVAGMRAFCPISQADRGFVADPNTLITRTMTFLVTEFKEGGKRVVLSRRAVLEKEAKVQAAQVLATLTPGTVVRGAVTSVREFGAFVDLGGIEGLIPNQELSHERGQRAEDVVSPGDVVEVQVRDIKEGVVDKRGNVTTKITLSLKALASDPWASVELVAPVGKVQRGTVTRMMDFGAFVRLGAGIEGLLHISELGGKVEHPSSVLKVGEQINVVVQSVDATAKKISLAPAADGPEVGTQATGPTLHVGSIVTGTIDRIETYGVFLQVEGTRGRVGRGLIPNAELGTPRGSDTRKLFPVGSTLQAKVLETGDGKLRMSIRAIKDDEERADFDGYRTASAASSKLGTFGDLFKKK